MQSKNLSTLRFPTWMLLLIAALNGLIYVFLVPPWQHNDEPGNFEFAWMFANFGNQRQEWMGKTDQSFRREVAASMLEVGFFEHPPGSKPNLILLDEQIWIGIQQTTGLPLYFWLVSLLLRTVRQADVVLQLYVARLFSMGLWMFTVYLVVLVNRELQLEQKWGSHLPLLFALFPSFVDKMTAVNDDVGAVAFFTLFLWLCLRIWKRGISPLNLSGLVFSTLLCVLTKRNVWVSAPLGLLIVLIVTLRRWNKFRWVIIGGLLALIPFVLFSWDNRTAAYYYAFRNYQLAQVIEGEKALAGKRIVFSPPGQHILYQPLVKEEILLYATKAMRIGFWLWGSEGTLRSPLRFMVNGINVIPNREIQISEQPSLVEVSIRLPKRLNKAALELNIQTSDGGEIYLDCVFLLPEISSDIPVPLDSDCREFMLGDSRVKNLIRNASFERTWLRLQPWLERWVDDKFQFSITHLWSIFDQHVGLPYLKSSGGHVFNTFWGRFGWGAVPLIGSNPYGFFWGVTVILGIANFGSLISNCRSSPIDLIFFLFLTVVSILVMTLFRNGGNWILYEATPNARYLLPAFLPLGLWIVNGWVTMTDVLFKNIKKKQKLTHLLWFGLLIGYNVWAMVSIWIYYAYIRS